MKPENKIDHQRQYEVTIEPFWIPGECRKSTEDFRVITIMVYAHNIVEAAEKAKALIYQKEEEIEITSIIAQGGWRSRRIEE